MYCEHSGTYESNTGVNRNTSTKKVGCCFQFSMTRQKVSDTWKVNKAHEDHSGHEMDSCVRKRQLDEKDINLIMINHQSGIAPRFTASQLQGKGKLISSQAIYKTVSLVKGKNNKGESDSQQLLKDLKRGGIPYRVHYVDNRINRLLIAPRTLWQEFNNIAYFDVTFKTNKFNLNLFHGVGYSCFNKIFTAFFAFASDSTTETYEWILQSLTELGFKKPKVVLVDRELALYNALRSKWVGVGVINCRWHIERNIEAKFKTIYKDDDSDYVHNLKEVLGDWRRLIASKSVSVYQEELKNFKERWDGQNSSAPGIFKYIDKTYLRYSETIIDVFIDKFCHFNQKTTSPAESAHRKVKSYLPSSKCKLRQVVSMIFKSIDQDSIAYEERFALENVLKDLRQGLEELRPCTGVYSSTTGFPCKHTLSQLMHSGEPLSPDHYSLQWKLVPFRVEFISNLIDGTASDPSSSASSSSATSFETPITQFDLFSPTSLAKQVHDTLVPIFYNMDEGTRRNCANDLLERAKFSVGDPYQLTGRRKDADISRQKGPAKRNACHWEKSSASSSKTIITRRWETISSRSIADSPLKFRKIAPKPTNDTVSKIFTYDSESESDLESKRLVHYDILKTPPKRRLRLKGGALRKDLKDCLNCGGNHDDCDGKSILVQLIFDDDNQDLSTDKFLVIDDESRANVEPDFEINGKQYHGYCEICKYVACEHINMVSQFKNSDMFESLQHEFESKYYSYFRGQKSTLSDRGENMKKSLGPMLALSNPNGLNVDSIKVLNGLAEGYRLEEKVFRVSLDHLGEFSITPETKERK